MAGNYRSGRPRIPTALHVLRGTRIRRRQHEPVAEPGVLTPTPEIADDPLALAHWTRVAEQLKTLRILTPAHRDMLAVLATTLADLERARAAWKAQAYAETITVIRRDVRAGTTTERTVENPLTRRTERLAMQARTCLGEFGLTPVTGPKVNASGPTAKPADARQRVARYVTPSG